MLLLVRLMRGALAHDLTFNIKRPGKVFKFTFGEFWDVLLFWSREHCLCCLFFLSTLPDIKTRLRNMIYRVVNDQHKRLAVYFHECKREEKPAKNCRERPEEKTRESQEPQNNNTTRSA